MNPSRRVVRSLAMPGVLGLVGSFLTLPAAADTLLITPTGITQTASDAPSGGNQPINLVNGSGLSAVPDASNYTTVTHSGGTWYTSAFVPNYFDQGGTPPQFLLPLGQAFAVTDLVVWGYGGNNNEASDFQVEFSSDGGLSYYASVDVATSSLLGTASAALPFGQEFLADSVRLTMTDNAGGRGFSGTGSGDRVGLGEIKLLGYEVPEPSTVVLLTSGLLGLALFGRRRRRSP